MTIDERNQKYPKKKAYHSFPHKSDNRFQNRNSFVRHKKPAEQSDANSSKCPLCKRFHQKGQQCRFQANALRYPEMDLSSFFQNMQEENKPALPYLPFFNFTICNSVKGINVSNIILDSGATDIMAKVANGNLIDIVGTGTIRWMFNESVFLIKNCFLIPELASTLIGLLELKKTISLKLGSIKINYIIFTHIVY
ncbi:hypothetical protein O9G_004871 [Rozella allomycis CSF55]|uniref:Uncharacterized protein n=1 Tax=Rozella allomycis (strain CSF55) TaxID=988480 RepID=A0A075ANJ9_ROZAC|nr:hypothetical protein O9G_004871 [Rozella allomycis CSF55]|eukprot:EPZ31442.1 hypothetical protein O9G_004871 [Rozella allomycis CSF55]